MFASDNTNYSTFLKCRTLHKFPRNFPVDGKVANFLPTSRRA